jgi:hypothetical protein
MGGHLVADAKNSNGEPTFPNLDEAAPKEFFTILIGGSDRERLGAPEDEDKGLRVCVTGKITGYCGRRRVSLRTADRSKFKSKKPVPKRYDSRESLSSRNNNELKRDSSLAKAKNQPCANPQIILPVVRPVVESRVIVISLDGAQGHAFT